jgi:hypothetical protein
MTTVSRQANTKSMPQHQTPTMTAVSSFKHDCSFKQAITKSMAQNEANKQG